MCRIAGIIDFNNSLGHELEPNLIKIRDSMIHGGPDDAGIFVSEDRKVSFAHRRLSIIDLSPLGHQPMANKEKTIWITFNGEIYNFQELKKELVFYGYNFISKTDTEVLIYGYEKWGIEGLLSKLRGMFAFAIYDERKKKVVIAKDRFGIKPLYYYKDSEKFIFSSEVKGFRNCSYIPNEKNRSALLEFLLLGSVPSPQTTIKNVFSLPSAHYIEIDGNGFKIKKYWDINSNFNKKENVSLNEATEKIKYLLEDSIKLHMISDVPLGVFLSGGIDSSALTALASERITIENQLNTLSIVFAEEEYCETPFARIVANRYSANFKAILLKKIDFINELPKIFSAMDEPTTDGVNGYFVSKAAKEAGLTVVLSGIGGDELFLGYDYYKKINFLNYIHNTLKMLSPTLQKSLINNLTKLKKISRRSFDKLSYLENPNNSNTYLMFRGLMSRNQVAELINSSEDEVNSLNLFPKFTESSLLHDLNTLDFNHYLQNQILKDIDFMSMTHSLEIRVPFLENNLFDYVSSLPSNLKFSDEMNKPLLVKSLGNDFPKEVWNRKKMGFTFPFQSWIKSEYKIFKDMSMESDLFDKRIVENMWAMFLNDRLHWSRIWALVVASRKF